MYVYTPKRVLELVLCLRSRTNEGSGMEATASASRFQALKDSRSVIESNWMYVNIHTRNHRVPRSVMTKEFFLRLRQVILDTTLPAASRRGNVPRAKQAAYYAKGA